MVLFDVELYLNCQRPDEYLFQVLCLDEECPAVCQELLILVLLLFMWLRSHLLLINSNNC